MTGAAIVLLILHTVWLTLLLSGHLRWHHVVDRPTCKECPVMKSARMSEPPPSTERTELGVLSL